MSGIVEVVDNLVGLLDSAAAKPRAAEALAALPEIEKLEQAARNRKDALTKRAGSVKASREEKPPK